MDSTNTQVGQSQPTPEIQASQRALAALLSLPDDAIDLAQASLLIAREEYPDLQVGDYLARLDEMGRMLRSRLRGGEGFVSQVAHMNRLLFDEMGFRGNREDYHDPRNSFLNDVLDRRIGIPVSLSTVYLEVGKRVGFRLAGVSFPAHFLVRHTGPGAPADVLIDPFNGGAIVTENDCRKRLHEMYRGQLPFRKEFLRRARNREILRRMIGNLSQIYQSERDYHRALRVQHLLLYLDPGNHEAVRDRGFFYYRLACFAQAARDLDDYLKAVPGAPDASLIRERLKALRALSPTMN